MIYRLLCTGGVREWRSEAISFVLSSRNVYACENVFSAKPVRRFTRRTKVVSKCEKMVDYSLRICHRFRERKQRNFLTGRQALRDSACQMSGPSRPSTYSDNPQKTPVIMSDPISSDTDT